VWGLARLSLFTDRCLGNAAVQRDSARPGLQPPAARNGTEQTPLPLLLRSVYSVTRRLAVGYLATLCCVIQQWVDMSQYVHTIYKICVNIILSERHLCALYYVFLVLNLMAITRNTDEDYNFSGFLL
jgi:hypothetical protein